MKFEAWNGFVGGDWENKIDVREFIQKNYTPYEGDESFLKGPTKRTTKLWDEVLELYKKEKEEAGKSCPGSWNGCRSWSAMENR